MKRILIITSGQPAGNPRMTKEAIALQQVGYLVTVIFCPMSPWGDDFDKELFIEHPQIKWISVGAHPVRNKYKYLFTRVRRKFWELIFRTIGNKFHSALRASCLYSQELEREAIKHKADLFIGHNLGSIKAVVESAEKHCGLTSFDFEDFYRGCSLEGTLNFKFSQFIEDEYCRFLDLSTFASPLILREYQKKYDFKKCKIVLNTVHKMKKSNFVDSYNDELKLFWFSQYIGKERGVESILKAMSILNNPKIKLTLLGNLSEISRTYFERLRIDLNLNKDQIVYEEPIKSSELEVFSSGFHIGLCTEESGISNVKYCLANKIFSYLIAGNALVLSDTEAHIEFMDRYKDIGSIYTQKNVKHLSVILNNYYTNRKLLDFHRSNALEFGVNMLNWDKESISLVKFYKESI